ncbi:MAG: hypothetical protein ACLVKA_11155, partial [Collinsella aerofaciens]
RLCDPSHQHQRRPSHLRPHPRPSGLKPAKKGQVYFGRFYLGKRHFHHRGDRHLCGGRDFQTITTFDENLDFDEKRRML